MTKRVATDGGAHIGGDVTAGGDVVGRDQYKVILGGPGTVPSTDPAEYLAALIEHPHYRPWARRYVPLAGAITEAQATPDWEPIAPALMLLESVGEGAQRQLKRVPLADIREAVTRHDAWVLLGEPGSGKTTTLQRLLIDLALEYQATGEGRLPLLLALADYRDYPSPHAFVAALWRQRVGTDDLEGRLRRGGVFLLVDALNEMPFRDATDYRARVGAWRRFATEEWPGNRIIFTCRGRDYSEPLGLPQVEIERLDDGRVRTFLDHYLGGDLVGTAWGRLSADPLLELVRNPFQLSILCRLVTEGAAWPRGRADIFSGLVESLLARERRRNHPDWPGAAALTAALAALAEGMQGLGEGTRLPRAEVLRRLPALVETPDGPVASEPQTLLRLGLAASLLDSEADPATGEPGGLVRFYHHQVQEFFAARALLAAWRQGRDLSGRWRAPRLQHEVPDPGPLRDDEPLPPPPGTGWEEPTLMAAGLAADPGALSAAVRVHNPVLAARCLLEPGVEAAPDERERTQAALLADLENPRVHRRARIAAGEALGRLGDPRLVAIAVEDARVLFPPLVEVPAGWVRLGSSRWEVWRLGRTGLQVGDERPRHRVRLPAFAIGRYPVTNAEYSCFIDDGGYTEGRWWDTEQARAWRRGELKLGLVDDMLNTWRKVKADPDLMKQWGWSDYNITHWQTVLGLEEESFRSLAELRGAERAMDKPAFWSDGRLANPAQPVVGVTWFEARAYCQWLTERWRALGDRAVRPLPVSGRVRLPTEAEWECAARLGTGHRFPWGNRWDPERANTGEGHVLRTTPVGVYPGGANPAGVDDLAGNCWEWCASLYLEYPILPDDGRDDLLAEGPRVVRGGSWGDPQRLARCTSRDKLVPALFFTTLGFRLVLSLADSGS